MDQNRFSDFCRTVWSWVYLKPYPLVLSLKNQRTTQALVYELMDLYRVLLFPVESIFCFFFAKWPTGSSLFTKGGYIGAL